MPKAPSADELIDDIRKSFQTRIDNAKIRKDLPEGMRMPANDDPIVEYARALSQQKEFEEILKNVPDGFALVPVYYSRITSEENEDTQNEYIRHVRPRFLQYVATHHGDDLIKLGMSQHGVDRMRKGLDPADEKGNLYHLSVDHIIERSGSGKYGTVRAQDDENGRHKRFSVNHFGNFILLPEKVHQFKNHLNTLQRITDVKPGNGQWFLMMIPKRDHEFSGFVCPPQKAGHPLHGIDFRTVGIHDMISHASFLLKQMAGSLDDFRLTEAGQTRAASNEDRKKLRSVFNAKVAKDADTQQILNTEFKPVIAETTRSLTEVFNTVEKRARRKNDKTLFKSFVQFFGKAQMRAMREELAHFPFDEAEEFVQTMQKISNEVEVIRGEFSEKATTAVPNTSYLRRSRRTHPRRK